MQTYPKLEIYVVAPLVLLNAAGGVGGGIAFYERGRSESELFIGDTFRDSHSPGPVIMGASP